MNDGMVNAISLSGTTRPSPAPSLPEPPPKTPCPPRQPPHTSAGRNRPCTGRHHAILRKINRMHGVCPPGRTAGQSRSRSPRAAQTRFVVASAAASIEAAARHRHTALPSRASPPARHAASQLVHLTGCVRNGCAEREQQHEAAEENTADG